MTPHPAPRRTARARFRSEDGIALVFVGIMLVVLFGAAAFIFDYGVMWVSRRQAQNAADAGALAGAVARAFDDTASPVAGGPAYTAALQATVVNQVWQDTPGVDIGWDCPGFVAPGGRCVQVTAHRDGLFGSKTLSTYFGALLGKTSLKVQATATAQAIPANATNCLRPWAVPDLWIERYDADPKNELDEYDKYIPNGKGAVYPGVVDDYVYPGYVNAMKGQRVTLAIKDPQMTARAGWSFAIDLPDSQGGRDYRENIEGCNGNSNWVGQYVPTLTGMKTGDLMKGIEALIAQDPYAFWDTGTNSVGCTGGMTCPPVSPRIVIVAVFDPDDWAYREAMRDLTPCPGGGDCVKIVNLFAFFVEGMQSNDTLVGYLVEKTGEFVPDTGWNVNPDAAFLWSIRLVR